MIFPRELPLLVPLLDLLVPLLDLVLPRCRRAGPASGRPLSRAIRACGPGSGPPGSWGLSRPAGRGCGEPPSPSPLALRLAAEVRLAAGEARLRPSQRLGLRGSVGA
jgi:hypothetical protein